MWEYIIADTNTNKIILFCNRNINASTICFDIKNNGITPCSCIDTNNSFKNLILVGNEAHFIVLLILIYGFKNSAICNYLYQKIIIIKKECFFLVGLGLQCIFFWENCCI